MNLFMIILRILAGGILIFGILDHFMGWRLFKPTIPFMIIFIIVYFFASLTQMLIRAKSLSCYDKKETLEPPEQK